jgi:RNA polymerase sigma-70 factor (ECF subfamily)
LTEEDRIIVDAIRAGDPAAFRDLYERHFRRIHSFSVRRLGNVAEADDVCQDVFEAVFCCLDRFKGESDLIVWIYGITRNILNNRLRRRGGVRLVSLEDIPQEAAPLDLGPESLAQARQTLGRVREAIGKLPQEQRRVPELGGRRAQHPRSRSSPAAADAEVGFHRAWRRSASPGRRLRSARGEVSPTRPPTISRWADPPRGSDWTEWPALASGRGETDEALDADFAPSPPRRLPRASAGRRAGDSLRALPRALNWTARLPLRP